MALMLQLVSKQICCCRQLLTVVVGCCAGDKRLDEWVTADKMTLLPANAPLATLRLESVPSIALPSG